MATKATSFVIICIFLSRFGFEFVNYQFVTIGILNDRHSANGDSTSSYKFVSFSRAIAPSKLSTSSAAAVP